MVSRAPFRRTTGHDRRVPQAQRRENGSEMRRYELMLLLRPDLEDDKLQSAVERVTRAIINADGNLRKISPWGKRRLAYQIQHHREASYFLLQFEVEPAAVREIERGILISEEILRHLVTVLPDRRSPTQTDEGEAPPEMDDDVEDTRPDLDESAGDEDVPPAVEAEAEGELP